VQALILIQMIIQTKDISADRFYRTLYESLLDPRLVTSSKQVMYLNLLYRSMKADVSAKRVQAFVKRLLQILSIHDPPFVCSALYLVTEVGKSFPAIHSMASDPEQLDDDVGNGTEADVYDPRKRDPLYSHADRSCLWELVPLETHFHPSVSLFASRLLFGGQAPPKPDPTLHTLMHFLDRFVYRNAKTSGPALRGNSIMQPLAGGKVADLLITDRGGARKEVPLNTEEFWAKDVKDVAVDKVFFHQYFARAGPKAAKAKKTKDKDAQGEGEDEDDIWKALVQSRPDIEGDDDDDLSELAELMSDDDEPEDESEVEINLDSDEPDSQDGFDAEENGSDSEAGFGLDALESDDDAMRDSEDEVSDETVMPEPKAENVKSATGDGKKKRKLKSLPLFASVDDYASLLQDDDDY
jgi:ribosome biogenesis protein MAK21